MFVLIYVLKTEVVCENMSCFVLAFGPYTHNVFYYYYCYCNIYSARVASVTVDSYEAKRPISHVNLSGWSQNFRFHSAREKKIEKVGIQYNIYIYLLCG